jgi:hypothetical protein
MMRLAWHVAAVIMLRCRKISCHHSSVLPNSHLTAPALLALLLLLLLQADAFKAKSGKFAIKGYPHKLGFLLHGPPGKHNCAFTAAIPCSTKKAIHTVTVAAP